MKKISSRELGSQDLSKAKEASLITFPEGIEAVNCGNCQFFSSENGGFCNHKALKIPVVGNKQCCNYWNHAGTEFVGA